MKTLLHILIFTIAGAVFFAGLAIGLQYNPDIGTLLWVIAAAIAGLNALWMSRSRR